MNKVYFSIILEDYYTIDEIDNIIKEFKNHGEEYTSYLAIDLLLGTHKRSDFIGKNLSELIGTEFIDGFKKSLNFEDDLKLDNENIDLFSKHVKLSLASASFQEFKPLNFNEDQLKIEYEYGFLNGEEMKRIVKMTF